MNSRFEQHPDSEWWSHMSRPHYLNLPDSLQEIAMPGDDFFDDDFQVANSSSSLETELPLSLFLPDPYEPRYRYPVIIWFHQEDSNEDELQTVMPQISEQNYIGLAFRGTSDDGQSPSGTFHWDASVEKRNALLTEIQETLAEMSRFFRLNTDRIYLAGFGSGATVALELLLAAPELFAGAMSLGGAIPDAKGHGVKFRQLSACKAFIGWGRHDHAIATQQHAEQAERLDQTGLLVETKLYDAGHELRPEMLKDLNHWLMTGCRSAFV